MLEAATALWLTLAQALSLPVLDEAYSQLRARRYDDAIAGFRRAIALAPVRPAIHKDLAYTLVKTGETAAARDAFAEAMHLDPSDRQAALEFAFLANDTGQITAARRVFDRLRKSGDPVAERAFQNIDAPLAEGIARWKRALEIAPPSFSAHYELAVLAERRDAFALAAEHYEKARALRPELRHLLVALGRVWREIGRVEDSHAALLAASRGPETRAAEAARALLFRRYPYIYEFRNAISLDPKNIELRRELAYLLLEMDRAGEAETEFAALLELAPGDLLSAAQLGFLRLKRKDNDGALPLLMKVLQGPDEVLADRVRSALGLPQALKRRPETPRREISVEAKLLAERSYQAGYLKDALKYLRIAHDTDPVDFSVILKLGWTYNLLRDDRSAVRWFALARRSPEAAHAAEAQRAHRNLAPQFARFRTTFWLFPFYSTRWRDSFGYAQAKTDVRIGRLPVRPYLSLRFVGDTRGTISEAMPQYLSESAVIAGLGLATPYWHGAMLWFEAGQALRYRAGGAVPDYRGGVAYAKGFGRLLGAESSGPFFETNADALYVSRFAGDTLLYAQNRAGYTLAPGGLRVQIYCNANLTADTQNQRWANFIESGPGMKFRWSGLPQSLFFTMNLLIGRYTRIPGVLTFTDFRVGFWYAVTR